MNIVNTLQFKGSWLFIFCIFLTLYPGCAGISEEKQEVVEIKPINMPIPPQNKLSPGTVKIEAYVIKIEKDSNYTNCILRVNKVLGYGMSTKPISKGTEISLHILDNQVDILKLLSEGTMEQKYELTVEQEQMVDNQLKCRALMVEKIYSEK